MSKSKGRKGSKSDPMDGLPSKPRLCQLDKGSGGYGFNLHGEKGKHGQFIRAVDPGSPADRAGIKPGDRVIEVSGTNIERETHSQVVARIRADGGNTVLLVADRDLDNYCKEHNITIKEDMTTDKDEGEDDDEPPLQVNGINGSTDAIVEPETPVIEPKKYAEEEEEERIEPAEEVREESQPEVIAVVPDPEPEPEPEMAQEPEEEETRPEENDVDEEIVAVTAVDVQAEPEPEREPTPEPEREPTPEPVREPTPPPPRELTPPPPREPTPPPREPTPPPREPTPPPPEPEREPTPPPPEVEEVDAAPIPLPEQKVSAPPARPTSAPKKSDNTGLDLSDMSKARALAAGKQKKKQAAQQDWRSKYNAFNQL